MAESKRDYYEVLGVDKSADEGDVLTEIDGIFTVDKAATEERRAAMREKMRRLIRRND